MWSRRNGVVGCLVDGGKGGWGSVLIFKFRSGKNRMVLTELVGRFDDGVWVFIE